MSPRGLSIAFGVSLLIAFCCFWMAWQTVDLTFLQCHGQARLDHPDPQCRPAAYYAYGMLAALGAAVLAAGTLVYRWIRRQ
jgi:hypothetical protein